MIKRFLKRARLIASVLAGLWKVTEEEALAVQGLVLAISRSDGEE